MKLNDLMYEFKQKLKNGGVIGCFSKTSDPGFIEIMGYAGMDYVIIDLEHGPNSIESVQNLIRAAQLSGILPIVRTKEDCPPVIGEALDIGAGGIQVPQIESKETAQEIFKKARFFPNGERGVCRFVRAADYSSKDRFKYFREADDTLIILQIEGQKGIDSIDEILEVQGIDIIFIGPYDLSQSLGIPGDIDNPLVEEKMLEIVNKCKEKNVVVGTFADTIENMLKWKNLGVKYISYSVDTGIFYDAVSNIVKKIKS